MDQYSGQNRESYLSYTYHVDHLSAPPVSRSPTVTAFSGTRTRNGSRNPNWREQIRNGVNATTTFIGHDVAVKPDWFQSRVQRWYRDDSTHIVFKGLDEENYGFLNYGTYPGSTSVPSSVMTSVRNRCIQKFLDSCTSARSSIEGGQDIGEYKETLGSIRHPMDSLNTSLNDYLSRLTKAKSKYKGKSSVLSKVLADTYLEWRFGINPLVEDVSAAIADAGRYRFPTVPVRGYAHERHTASSITVAPTFGGSTYHLRMNRSSYGEYSLRYKGAIRTNTNADSQISRAQAFQLTPDRWAPTAWDLLPYSWIADYFANIGNIIGALSFVYSDIVWGCSTERKRSIISYSAPTLLIDTFFPGTHVYDTIQECSGGNASFETRDVTRFPLSSADLLPEFEIKIPTSKYPYMNMGALLLSRFSKLVPFF